MNGTQQLTCFRSFLEHKNTMCIAAADLQVRVSQQFVSDGFATSPQKSMHDNLNTEWDSMHVSSRQLSH